MGKIDLDAACKAVDNAVSICGDGKRDVKDILAALVGKAAPEARTYHTGTKLRFPRSRVNSTSKYIIASCGCNIVVLVNPDNGNRRGCQVEVGNDDRITDAEIRKMTVERYWEVVEDE